MPVQVLCPKCQKALSVSDEVAGRRARCPSCGTAFQASASTAGARSSTAGASPAAGPASDVPSAIGPYAVSRKLGEGAFGVVYKGLDAALGRDVAIKVLRPSALGSAKYVERFLREAKVVGQMHHGNIVPVYQLGQHAGGYFIASAFIPGKSLADVIPEDGLEPRRAVALVLQLLEALAYAHDRGVLHRDVKPSNAMLDDKDTLFLMDFGLAGLVGQDEGRMTQDGTVMGTPAYMPPEQARGTIQEVGPAADQYSAGVVLYELLTGHLPFEGGPLAALIYNVINTPPPAPSEWRPIDAQLEEICVRALAKAPAQRFPGCRDFAGALRDWLAVDKPAPAAPDKRADGPPKLPQAPALVQTTSAVGKGTTVNVPRAGQTAVAPPPVVPAPAARPPAPGKSRRGWLLWGGIAWAAIAVIVTVSLVVVKMAGKRGGSQGIENKSGGFYDARDK